MTFALRCLPCNTIVCFGDGTAAKHVTHGIAVEWPEPVKPEPPAEQVDLFAPVAYCRCGDPESVHTPTCTVTGCDCEGFRMMRTWRYA